MLQLPGHVREAADLLLAQGQKHAKASALKSGRSAAPKEARTGPELVVDAVHADGQPCRLHLQVPPCVCNRPQC